MRILMVSQMAPYLPCHDGFRVLPAHLLRCLSGRHEFHLLALCQGDETPEQLGWASQYCASVKLLHLDRDQGWAARVRGLIQWGTPSLAEETQRRIADIRPEVVHLEGPTMAPLAAYAQTGMMCLLSVHDSLSLRYDQFAGFASRASTRLLWRLRAARSRWLEKRWYGELDRVVVFSPDDAHALARSVPPDRLAAVPLGVDLERLSYRPEPQPGRIVFTGNMSWPPNVDAAEYFVRESFPQIRRQRPEASFWIVGACPSRRVEALAGMAGVKVTGTVPDIREFIWSAWVYVSPLRFGAGIKNKILEAMALGAPIVATPPSLTGTLLKDGQEVLVARHPAEIAEAVLRLLGDEGLCRSLSLEARRRVETEYSWPRIAGEFEALWRLQ
jgi:glycosyltransferase involved in cell wall biosynthesis